MNKLFILLSCSVVFLIGKLSYAKESLHYSCQVVISEDSVPSKHITLNFPKAHTTTIKTLDIPNARLFVTAYPGERFILSAYEGDFLGNHFLQLQEKDGDDLLVRLPSRNTIVICRFKGFVK